MLRLFQSITGPVFLLLAISVASYAAEPVRIDNLTFNSGQMTYRAEGIELEGVNLSAESMEALLHGTDIAAQAKALSTLDAAMIKVSRLRQTLRGISKDLELLAHDFELLGHQPLHHQVLR